MDITGVRDPTLFRRWVNDAVEPPLPAQRRLAWADAALAAFSGGYGRDHEEEGPNWKDAASWFSAANEKLAGRSPREAFVAGEYRAVFDLARADGGWDSDARTLGPGDPAMWERAAWNEHITEMLDRSRSELSVEGERTSPLRWMSKKRRALDGARPRDLIRRDDFRTVYDLACADLSGSGATGRIATGWTKSPSHISRLRNELGSTVLCETTEASADDLNLWIDGGAVPQPQADRMAWLWLARLRRMRSGAVGLAAWLTTPDPLLEGRSPAAALREGERWRVLDSASIEIRPNVGAWH